MPFALAVPFAVWLGLLALARRRSGHGGVPADPVTPVLLASAGAGSFLVISSESLGAIGRFSAGPVTLVWILFGLALAVALARSGPAAQTDPFRGVRREDVPRDARFLLGLSVLLWLLLLPLVTHLPQTNWDTLTYHLPRVLRWVQSGSLSAFPSDDFRQNEFAPFASYGVALLFLLGGGDRLVGSVQWLALGGAAAAAALLAGQLLGSSVPPGDPLRRRAAALAAVLVVSAPVALVQATTCQNDLTAAFWTLAFVSLARSLAGAPESRALSWGAAASLALALLSKETVVFAAFPFLVWMGLRLVSGGGFRALGRTTLAVAVCFTVLHAGHFARKASASGSPFGSRFARESTLSADRSPSAFASGVLRSFLLYTATGIPAASDALNEALVALHRLTGRAVDDPATTYGGARFTLQTAPVSNDSFVNTPWAPAAAGLGLLLLASSRIPARRRLALHGGLAVAGLIVTCGLLRWQPFLVRFHLVSFLLLAPVAGIALARTLRPAALSLLGAALCANGLWALAANQTRPLSLDFLSLPRERQLLWAEPRLYEPFRRLSTALVVSGCREVGLSIGFLQPEYALFAFARDRGSVLRFRHVAVSTPVPDPMPGSPCVVVTSEVSSPSSQLPVPVAARRRFLPDTAPVGPFRLHMDPASSGWALLTSRAADSEVPVGPGATLELRDGRTAPLTLWSGRAGVLRIAISGSRGPARLRLQTEAGLRSDLEEDRSGWSVALPVPGGAVPFTLILLDRRSGSPPALTLSGVQFDPADDLWTAVGSVGDELRSPELGPASFRVGPRPTALRLLSRKGGGIRLRLRIEPPGDASGSSPSVRVFGDGVDVGLGVGERELVVPARSSMAVVSLETAANPGTRGDAGARVSVVRTSLD